MSEYIQASNSEISFINASRISCDGPSIGRHPRITLTLNGGVEGEVVCPYCSHTFRFQEEALVKPAKTTKSRARKAAPKKAAPKKRAAKRKAS